eukprot:Nitzschia sp. Nitz4//scaffold5_size260463//118602//124210//NITZ4_000980-RA/size260463-snap-gene-0.42-mRNA-1//-1//CDS//3329555334//3830//frame0
MLKLNFLGNWAGEEDPHPTLQTPPRRFIAERVNGDSSEEEDDDETARRLLMQFPAYGTRSQAQSNNQTADWLLGGTSNIPSQQQLLLQQEQKQQERQAEEENLIDEKVSRPSTDAPKVTLVNPDWDKDEQQLWHSKVTPSPKAKVDAVVKATNSQESSPERKPLTDSAKIWLTAYYYHTGVTPNIEMTRRDPMFERHQPNRLGTSIPQEPKNKDPILPQVNMLDDNRLFPRPRAPSMSVSGIDGEHIPEIEDRQHWMPDRLCKHCYACDSPFNVFRRRHHCRICGQVFCNSCSGYFVPAVQHQQHSGGQTPQSANKTILRACKMCYDQVTERQQLLEEEEEDAGRKKRKKEETGVPPPQPVLAHPPTQPSPQAVSPALQEQLERGDTVLHNLNKKRTETDYVKRRLQVQEEKLEQAEKEQASMLLQEQNQSEKMQMKQEVANSQGVLSPKRPGSQSTARNSSSGNLTTMSSDTNSSQTNNSTTNSRLEQVEAANRHLGLTAATHLEQLGISLLASDAPLLFTELTKQSKDPKALYAKWISTLMGLVTRCCATVDPNVKGGDLLDIRPYVKIKVIPGGTYEDCAYVSGILFRKTVSHKKMAKEIPNPSIMLLSGGIEFTRTENRIASLETLMEQEGKYIEILVGKILKLKPDVLFVGKAVSRKAQELLLKANVTLVQHVKPSLLSRISRQTGATIISSTDHIMNQFGAHVLGRCNRFRIIVARDNEGWIDGVDLVREKGKTRRNIKELLQKNDLSNAERQSVLAANMLGENILDGYQAVKSGLAKRGVAQSYVMLEGCPKHLGCTVVLRGASRAALKQVKIVFRFLINTAYNLRLETSFFRERCATIQPEYQVNPANLFSSSLCVDYGTPSSSRKSRPWNGGPSNEGAQRSISGQISAFDHQAILISSVWMTDKTQCCPAEVKGICYYSMQDVSLGQFLRDSCFNLSLKCQNPSCKKSVLDHSLSFVHNDGLVNITVDHMEEPLPPAPMEGSRRSDVNKDDNSDADEVDDPPIATWTYCKNCSKVVTPLTYLSENTWKYSFGKFLESFFYNRQLVVNSPQSSCQCSTQAATTLYFGCGRLAARFTHESVLPFGVFVRKALPIDTEFHRTEALRELELISRNSSVLFVKFDKHIEKVSREARALGGANRSDHLQTVLSELHRISSEVDHAAKTLQEKIASVSEKCSKNDNSVVSDALLRFPWYARRYLFMLTSTWNEKLSAAGQAIVAMKKLAYERSDGLVGQNVPAIVGDQNHDELQEGMRRLRQLHEVYSRYNIADITTVLPTFPGNNVKADIEYDDDFEDPDGNIDFADGVDADVLASRRRFHQSNGQLDTSKGSTKSSSVRRNEDNRSVREIPNSAVSAKVTPGGAVKSALTRFFNRGGRESDPYVVDLGIFSEGRPRLEPGVNGIVVPVIDDQLCTVIAYSLSSKEYASQYQSFASAEGELSEPKVTLDPPGGAPSLEQNSQHSKPPAGASMNDKQGIERRMLVRNKSHIKHTFRDFDEKGQNLCKFVCTTYWATQFQAVRQAFLSPQGTKGPDGSMAYPSDLDVEQAYIQSLSSTYSWAASGGKSGASFARTSDDRFVIKCISRTELQMFLESAPAYFEYLSKAFFHALPTVLCKIVGVYQIGYHNRVTGKRSMEQVTVMHNIFYNKKISRIFDLKGSLRGRFASTMQRSKGDSHIETPTNSEVSSQRRVGSELGSDGRSHSEVDDKDDSLGASKKESGTLLDGDFLEFTAGRPMPMNDRAKAVFHMSILNDTLFLSIINVLDYSILVGIDEDRMELVVGIIDFMRQYDILKQMERVGKSLPMVVGSEAPTIIQPPLYKARFTNAMERYFMTVPSKWTAI